MTGGGLSSLALETCCCCRRRMELTSLSAGARRETSSSDDDDMFHLMTADAVRQMRSGSAAVEQGAEVTGFARESIEKIVREADSLGSMVAQIACSATQQAAATEQVTASMSQISELARESAEGSQLSAHACEELLNLALGLQNMVDRFDVGQREKDEVRTEAAMQWGDAA